MVELSGKFEITSNRESGFGRYDIMLTPKNREKDCAYIIGFKVHKPLREKDLAQTVANAHAQIEEKLYDAKLIADGFPPEQICKYGFAFKGMPDWINIALTPKAYSHGMYSSVHF